MGEQLKMLTRTLLVCLIVRLSHQKEIQKNDTASLQDSYPYVEQEEYLLRSRRSNKLPSRTTFKTEIGITRRLLNEFNGDMTQAENWVLSRSNRPTIYSNIALWTQN